MQSPIAQQKPIAQKTPKPWWKTPVFIGSSVAAGIVIIIIIIVVVILVDKKPPLNEKGTITVTSVVNSTASSTSFILGEKVDLLFAPSDKKVDLGPAKWFISVDNSKNFTPMGDQNTNKYSNFVLPTTPTTECVFRIQHATAETHTQALISILPLFTQTGGLAFESIHQVNVGQNVNIEATVVGKGVAVSTKASEWKFSLGKSSTGSFTSYESAITALTSKTDTTTSTVTYTFTFLPTASMPLSKTPKDPENEVYFKIESKYLKDFEISLLSNNTFSIIQQVDPPNDNVRMLTKDNLTKQNFYLGESVILEYFSTIQLPPGQQVDWKYKLEGGSATDMTNTMPLSKNPTQRVTYTWKIPNELWSKNIIITGTLKGTPNQVPSEDPPYTAAPLVTWDVPSKNQDIDVFPEKAPTPNYVDTFFDDSTWNGLQLSFEIVLSEDKNGTKHYTIPSNTDPFNPNTYRWSSNGDSQINAGDSYYFGFIVTDKNNTSRKSLIISQDLPHQFPSKPFYFKHIGQLLAGSFDVKETWGFCSGSSSNQFYCVENGSSDPPVPCDTLNGVQICGANKVAVNKEDNQFCLLEQDDFTDRIYEYNESYIDPNSSYGDFRSGKWIAYAYVIQSTVSIAIFRREQILLISNNLSNSYYSTIINTPGQHSRFVFQPKQASGGCVSANNGLTIVAITPSKTCKEVTEDKYFKMVPL